MALQNRSIVRQLLYLSLVAIGMLAIMAFAARWV